MNIRSMPAFLRIALGFILVCSLALGSISPASAQGLRCYVDVDATGGANTGGSWENAYTDLQSALGASPCTEVWVAEGTYTPTPSTDRMVSFVLKSGVAIYGGFAGTETLLSERDPAANVTVLSGDIGVAGDPADNSYHVVVGSGTDGSAVLDGFTIAAGNVDGASWPFNAGGGMLNEGAGSPTLTNVTFNNNSAASYGGGMYNYSGSPSLTNVTFNNNSAREGGGMVNWGGGSPSLTNVTFNNNSAVHGGGMVSRDGSPTLVNVIFSSNFADDAGGMENWRGSPSLVNVTFSKNSAGYGGGMLSYQGSPRLTNVTFSGNQGGGMVSHSDENASLTNVTFNNNSAWEGGGMVNYYGNPSLVKVTFINNSAQHGGGMYDSGSPGLVNVAFSGNTAYYEGGGMYTSGSPSLVNVTFSNNTAGYGGGMRNYGGSPRLTNVTFSGNSGDWGGGMYSHFGSPRLTNVTFSGNSAFRGGGIYSDSGSPILINSILYGDTGGEISKDQGSVAVTYSIVQDGYPGTGNLNTDPLLQSLGDNGGFTETMALGAGSPAIDKGTNTGCPAKDQRGVVRPQRQRCDMGAYEYPDSKLSLSSAGAYDGWVLEAGEDSGVGGTLNAAGSALVAGDTAQDRQYRSILSFKTGVLPDGAVITSVVLKLKGAGVAGTDPFSTHGSLLVDVRKGVFSDDAALQIQDFQAPSSQDAVMTILNKPVKGWYTRGLGLGGFAYINKTGPTQFRLRFAVDDNDDGAADYVKFYSGNITTLAYRPQLIITYYMP